MCDLAESVSEILEDKEWQFKVYKKEEAINVKVTYRQLRSITGNAGAEFTAKAPLIGDQLLINMNSGASGKFEVAVNVLKLEAIVDPHQESPH